MSPLPRVLPLTALLAAGTLGHAQGAAYVHNASSGTWVLRYLPTGKAIGGEVSLAASRASLPAGKNVTFRPGTELQIPPGWVLRLDLQDPMHDHVEADFALRDSQGVNPFQVTYRGSYAGKGGSGTTTGSLEGDATLTARLEARLGHFQDDTYVLEAPFYRALLLPGHLQARHGPAVAPSVPAPKVPSGFLPALPGLKPYSASSSASASSSSSSSGTAIHAGSRTLAFQEDAATSSASASAASASAASASSVTPAPGPAVFKAGLAVPPLTVVNDSGHEVELLSERLPAAVQLRAELAGQLSPFEAAFARNGPLSYLMPAGAVVTLTLSGGTSGQTVLSVPVSLTSAVGPWRQDCFWVVRSAASGAGSPPKASLAWYSRVKPANLQWDRRAHQLTITD